MRRVVTCRTASPRAETRASVYLDARRRTNAISSLSGAQTGYSASRPSRGRQAAGRYGGRVLRVQSLVPPGVSRNWRANTTVEPSGEGIGWKDEMIPGPRKIAGASRRRWPHRLWRWQRTGPRPGPPRRSFPQGGASRAPPTRGLRPSRRQPGSRSQPAHGKRSGRRLGSRYASRMRPSRLAEERVPRRPPPDERDLITVRRQSSAIGSTATTASALTQPPPSTSIPGSLRAGRLVARAARSSERRAPS